VWSKEEIERTLSHQAELFCQFYGVTPGGNFEGHNILHRPRSLGDQAVALGYTEPVLAELLAELRGRLLAARAARVRPLRDDKVLVSWNALMIAALAEAGAVMNESVYLEAAGRAADFLLEE
ncbi:MAG: thioredoxin domain-containing protein, partial [Pirellulaceae bacterium]